MKRIAVIFLYLVTFASFSQDSTRVERVQTRGAEIHSKLDSILNALEKLKENDK